MFSFKNVFDNLIHAGLQSLGPVKSCCTLPLQPGHSIKREKIIVVDPNWSMI